MKRHLLAILILFTLTACNERRGVEAPTYIPNVSTQISSIQKPEVEHSLLVDIPILEEGLPILPVPDFPENLVKEEKIVTSTQTFNGGKQSKSLDMGAIRTSHSESRTRLVFDSYRWMMDKNTPSEKSKFSGKYSFIYDASNKRITVTIHGYKSFSALGEKGVRQFPNTSIIDTIKLNPSSNHSIYKFNINLRDNATVKVFELKAPGRIIVDITK